MQVAYVETTCHCDDEGFEAFTWDHKNGALRTALPGEDPILRLKCAACGGTRSTRIAVLLDHQPVEPLTNDEIMELLVELDELREEIGIEELTRPYVRPSLIERHDDLCVVEELDEFEKQITMLERNGVLVMPALLRHREELRAMVRGLLPAAA